MCSLAVVLLSLLEPFGVHLCIPPNAINLASAAISLLILTVSLLVNGYKYGERAEKMHAGAVEINSVGRRLEPAIAQKDTVKIEALSEEYENILKAYENHKDVDYKVGQIKRYAKLYEVTWRDKAWCWVLLQWDILPHTLPLLLMTGVVYFVLRGAHL